MGRMTTSGDLPIATAVRATTTAAISALAAYLLKFFPLIWRQHLLQTFISLPPDVVHTRLRLAAQCAQLLARIAEDLLHLRFLIRIQLQTLRQLLEAIARLA